MEKPTFTICIEERGKPTREIVCAGTEAPDLIVDGYNNFYIKRGAYASPGNKYMYHRATPYNI